MKGEEGLTPEDLEALLAALGKNREEASRRYLEIRRKLVRLFEWRGCLIPDDMTDVTINRVARRLAQGVELHAADPYSYFCGVANLVHKEYLRTHAKEIAVLEAEAWPPPPPQDPADDERLGLLNDCLQTLDAEQRELVLEYHRDENHIDSRKALSLKLRVPPNALRIRVHRLRRKLEDCVTEKLQKGDG